MKKLAQTIALALIVMTTGPLRASELNDSLSQERIGISFRDLKICHQHDWRNLTLDLEYNAVSSSPAMNVQEVKQFIRRYLEEYSNQDDFWEIMNTNLTHAVVKAFPDIKTLKSTLSLEPDASLKFPRKSIVTYDEKQEALKESFNFTKLNYMICQKSFKSLDLHVTWDMKTNPGPFDYPNYQWVDEAMQEFFSDNPVSFSEWKALKPRLENFLLERFQTLEAIKVEITIVE